MEAIRGALLGMKNSMNNAGVIGALLLVLGFIAGGTSAQPTTTGHANDFSSVEYFEPPHQLQMSMRLAGAEAQPLAGGLLVIKELKLETFDSNGVPGLIVKAPECVYDTVHGMANSPGHVRLESADGRSHVEGNGFLWRRSDHFLTISNDVQTVIEPGPTKKTGS
jgi:hypothetical protein